MAIDNVIKRRIFPRHRSRDRFFPFHLPYCASHRKPNTENLQTNLFHPVFVHDEDVEIDLATDALHPTALVMLPEI